MEKTRDELIHEKGFDMTTYGKMKVGLKTLDDATLDLGYLKKIDRNLYDKYVVMRALADKDVEALRAISNNFYISNGIYQKVCNYIANLYRYDWYVVPEIYDDGAKEDKVVKEFVKILNYLDNTHVKKTCGDIALKVIKDGVYYGYLIEGPKGASIQELPPKYCRSRYEVGGNPAVEFNMRFFDEKFPDINYRMRVIKMFPAEFAKGYMLYKQGKLKQDTYEDNQGWFLLDPAYTLKFSLNNNEIPFFVNAIPAILDLDAAQDLDRRKQMQKLLKIVIQKLPMDKNGDLIFDVDEARDIHNNAVQMLRRAIGVDVLTTFADIDSIDMSDKNTATSTDDLEKVERAVFNSMGLSQNLFNTDGNMSLEKSVLNDESSMRSLLLQFGMLFDRIAQDKSSNPKKWNFRLYMLETTQYNYKEISKMYKEHVQIGYSKMLPQIALGHTQSAIINTAYFENDILHLSEIMIPPLMSSTMRGEDILGSKDGSKTASNNKGAGQASTKDKAAAAGATTKAAGRPEKPDDQKSDKTIQNKESMS